MNGQVYTGNFWSRYDWSDPDAQKHLLDVKKGEDGSIPQLNGNDLEWTREGLEEILATVGVQCVYSLEVCSLLCIHFTSHAGF